MLNEQFASVFYKNNLASGVAIMNLYMVSFLSFFIAYDYHSCSVLTSRKIFGGTNWGNLGHPGGYTSYDYAAAISESRNVTRDKYSELKLIGNFLKVSPSYLDTVPGSASTTGYADTSDLTVTPLLGQSSHSNFYVIRHTDYSSTDVTHYKLTLPTSNGTVTIPQEGGVLTLTGRDSKIFVTDYKAADTNIIYSTAEILTWKKFAHANYSAAVVYGGDGELVELAVDYQNSASVVKDPHASVKVKTMGRSAVIQCNVTSAPALVKIDNLWIIMVGKFRHSLSI